MRKLAAIIGLLFSCGPAAILRSVVPVIVDSINRIAATWAWPHIRKKVFEIAPSFANRDSLSSPSWEPFGRCIQAAFPHMQPSAIFRPFRSAVFPVGTAIMKIFEALLSFFYSQASAAFRIATSQRMAIHNAFFAAFTLALPCSIPVWRINAIA